MCRTDVSFPFWIRLLEIQSKIKEYFSDLHYQIRTLVPKKPNELSNILTCVYLSQNRGFLVYGTLCRSTQASIISTDIENGTYELIGNTHTFPNNLLICCDFIRKDFVIVIKGEWNHLDIFTIDPSSFNIKSHQKISGLDYGSCLFGLIDGKLVFTNVLGCCGFSRILGNFMVFENEGSFTEIENTSVKVDIPRIDNARWVWSFLYYFSNLTSKHFSLAVVSKVVGMKTRSMLSSLAPYRRIWRIIYTPTRPSIIFYYLNLKLWCGQKFIWNFLLIASTTIFILMTTPC